MPKFAANLTLMFNELEPPDRFAAARDAGFTAVEYLNPFEHDIKDIKYWLRESGLEMILLNTQMGDAHRGERGLAALPGREKDFRVIFDQALEYASALGVSMIHVMAGVVSESEEHDEYERTFVENLRLVAPLARERNIRLMIEPLNTVDMPDYLHSRSSDTRRLIEAIDADNVQMQFDFYHLQIMEGNLSYGLQRHLDVIGHVQFSSVPGRNEPQYGEVNHRYLFALLDEIGYTGWVGCEYRPKTTTLEGLEWGEPYGLQPNNNS